MRQIIVNQPPNFGDMFVPSKSICTQGLLEEVCLFACSPKAVELYGGVHTRVALRQLMESAYPYAIARGKEEGLQPVVDVRIHRLFPRQFPAVPGWHCTHVPRGGYTGQPNFGLCSQHAFHVGLILSDQPAGCSNTEYVIDPIKLFLEDPDHVYKEMHKEVDRIRPRTELARDGRFVWFNQRSIHRASPASRRGVRLYMRLSMVDKPFIANEQHATPQVYQLAEENGW